MLNSCALQDPLPSISFASTPDLVLPLLRKILEHAAQQCDVQTAVTLSLILGRKTVVRTPPKREARRSSLGLGHMEDFGGSSVQVCDA